MLIIHKITAMVQNMDPFYVRYPDPSKVAPHVNYRGINFTAEPLRVHEDPRNFHMWDGYFIYHLTGEDMYFTTPYQAERVFVELYGRAPDPGTELRSVEMTQQTSAPGRVDQEVFHRAAPDVDPVLYGQSVTVTEDQTERDAIQADYQAEQRETDRYGSPEHADPADERYYRDCPGAW